MRLVRFAIRSLALGLSVFVACMAVGASPSSAVQGKAHWYWDAVRYYFVTGQGGAQFDIGPGPVDYPHRELLTKVNPEFAKRVDVLMAVYHAAGGKNVGIVPGTGALRSADAQLALYKQCRRPPPGGTEASAVSTWVDDLRDAGNQPTTNKKTGHFVKSSSCPEGGPVTWETVSWHNVGLAVDFGQYKSGKYNNGDAFLQTPEFQKVYAAMDSLGMPTGDSFGDPAHVDWHPYLTKPTQAGASGTAGTVNPAYAWNFPDSVYFWTPNLADRSTGYLVVYDFGADGNWITVKARRSIQINSKGTWFGTWETYSPAVKVFPAYIPTRSLQNPKKLFKAVSAVEIKSYSINAGKEDWRDTKGSLEYYPGFDVSDLQKEANVVIGKARALRAKSCGETVHVLIEGCGSEAFQAAIMPYGNLNAESYYNVHFSTASATGLAQSPVTVRAHSDWHPGGPDDWERSALGDLRVLPEEIGWNRDKGSVGWPIEHSERLRGSQDVYSLKSTNLSLQVISSKLPAGAMDYTGPPSWPF